MKNRSTYFSLLVVFRSLVSRFAGLPYASNTSTDHLCKSRRPTEQQCKLGCTDCHCKRWFQLLKHDWVSSKTTILWSPTCEKKKKNNRSYVSLLVVFHSLVFRFAWLPYASNTSTDHLCKSRRPTEQQYKLGCTGRHCKHWFPLLKHVWFLITKP